MDENEKTITLTHEHIEEQYGSLLKSLNATKRIFWSRFNFTCSWIGMG